MDENFTKAQPLWFPCLSLKIWASIISPNSAKNEVMSFSVLEKNFKVNLKKIKIKGTNFLGFGRQKA